MLFAPKMAKHRLKGHRFMPAQIGLPRLHAPKARSTQMDISSLLLLFLLLFSVLFQKFKIYDFGMQLDSSSPCAVHYGIVVQTLTLTGYENDRV